MRVLWVAILAGGLAGPAAAGTTRGSPALARAGQVIAVCLLGIDGAALIGYLFDLLDPDDRDAVAAAAGLLGGAVLGTYSGLQSDPPKHDGLNGLTPRSFTSDLMLGAGAGALRPGGDPRAR